MTQEDKSLLLQDLCARLPYGVMIQIPELFYPQRKVTEKLVTINDLWHFNDDGTYIENVKPYLRPMSSMTEEERDEVEEISHGWFYINEDGEIYPTGRLTDSGEFEDAILPTFEYFMKNHIDYRGLIPKDLALEAPEGMYNITK